MRLASIPRKALCGVAGILALLLAPAAASAQCPNEDRRAEQAQTVPLVMDLPDCMALEMVSPPVKFNQRANLPTVSADGKRVRFRSVAALAGTPFLLNAGGDFYVAGRGGEGWQTQPTTPSAGMFGQVAEARSFTADLSRWVHVAASVDAHRLQGITRTFTGGLGGLFAPLSPLLVPIAPPQTAAPFEIPGFGLQGVAPDHSTVYFVPGPGEGSGSDRTISFHPDDPVPAGTGEDRNVYFAALDADGSPSLTLLTRDKEGKAWGGNCGARLGGIGATGGTGVTAPNGMRNRGAISPDGSRVYFSSRAAQPQSGNCTEANKMRILERLETPDGPEISELIASECEREAPEPACATHDGDDLYQGASVDQTKVYFTTNRQLADTDTDGSATPCALTTAVAGCDLYLYDSAKPEGEQLTQVSAGEDIPGHHEAGKEAKVYNAIATISTDGSRAYFAAQGVLTDEENPEGDRASDYAATTPKLYAWNAESGELAFVGALASGDQGTLWGSGSSLLGNGAYPVPLLGEDGAGNEVGGSGHLLFFQSRASLTEDDTDGGFRDIFRYDAAEHTLERISKAAPGGSEGGHHAVVRGGAGGVGTDFAVNGRWVSEDGRTVVFTTGDGLLPGDPSGLEDAYLWRDGDLHRLPGTTTALDAGAPEASQPVLSHDGATVAFTSLNQLLPADGDTINDVYVARAGGGFPHIVPQTCLPDGEAACQGGAPAAAPVGIPGPAEGGNPAPRSDCGAIAKRVRNLTQRARQLRRRAGRTDNTRQARRLNNRARRAGNRARNLKRNVQRCRQNNRRAGQ